MCVCGNQDSVEGTGPGAEGEVNLGSPTAAEERGDAWRGSRSVGRSAPARAAALCRRSPDQGGEVSGLEQGRWTVNVTGPQLAV